MKKFKHNKNKDNLGYKETILIVLTFLFLALINYVFC